MRVEHLRGGKRIWNSFMSANGGGILQSYEWGEFRTDLDWRVKHLGVRDGNELLLAALLLKKRLPGGYAFWYCPEGPVVKGGDWSDLRNQEAFATLNDWLQRHAKDEKVLFCKVDPHIAEADFPTEWLDGQGFNDSPEDIQAAVVAHVDLQASEEEIFAAMKQKGRYNTRQAIKAEITVKSSKSEKALDTFYDLLEQTAKRQGISYREKWYYTLFQKHFMQRSDLARFFIATREGRPVAATLVTFFGNEAIYLYGGSSDEDRTTYGSYLVQWAGIQEAKRRGCSFYNMTGIAATDDPEHPWAGLRQFKLKFGAEQVHLLGARDYQYMPLRYRLFTTAERGRRFFAKRSGR